MAVVALYKLSAKYAVMLNLIRIVVAGLLFTGVFGMLYSLAGATISLIGMILLKKTDLSALPVSVWQVVSYIIWVSSPLRHY